MQFDKRISKVGPSSVKIQYRKILLIMKLHVFTDFFLNFFYFRHQHRKTR